MNCQSAHTYIMPLLPAHRYSEHLRISASCSDFTITIQKRPSLILSAGITKSCWKESCNLDVTPLKKCEKYACREAKAYNVQSFLLYVNFTAVQKAGRQTSRCFLFLQGTINTTQHFAAFNKSVQEKKKKKTRTCHDQNWKKCQFQSHHKNQTVWKLRLH